MGAEAKAAVQGSRRWSGSRSAGCSTGPRKAAGGGVVVRTVGRPGAKSKLARDGSTARAQSRWRRHLEQGSRRWREGSRAAVDEAKGPILVWCLGFLYCPDDAVNCLFEPCVPSARGTDVTGGGSPVYSLDARWCLCVGTGRVARVFVVPHSFPRNCVALVTRHCVCVTIFFSKFLDPALKGWFHWHIIFCLAQLSWFALLVVFSVVTNGVKSTANHDGSFAFSYEADDGSYRQEIRNSDGSFRVEYGKTADEFGRRNVVKFSTENLPEKDEVKTNCNVVFQV